MLYSVDEKEGFDYFFKLLNEFLSRDKQLEVNIPSKHRLQFGSAKDKVWLSDDFDKPLEDFKEYME